ncbi:MAG: DUF234 domain-containing protein [Caldilineaceae bacterium]
MGIQDQALDEIRRHLRDFIGAHTWEELCREWVLRAAVKGELSLSVDQVGSAWTQRAQVDVVGINTMEKTLILGECKWGAQAMGREVLVELVHKTAEIVPEQGQWRVLYVGFARAGWTDAAQQFAQEQSPTPANGANWRVVGMRLVDLTQVDLDLTQWTTQ